MEGVDDVSTTETDEGSELDDGADAFCPVDAQPESPAANAKTTAANTTLMGPLGPDIMRPMIRG